MLNVSVRVTVGGCDQAEKIIDIFKDKLSTYPLARREVIVQRFNELLEESVASVNAVEYEFKPTSNLRVFMSSLQSGTLYI